MLEQGSVKADDELIEHYGLSDSRRIVKVAKITPSGQIVLSDGRRFRNDGVEMSSDMWHKSTLSMLTPEKRNQMAKDARRKANIYTLDNTRWSNVDDEKLEQIIAILKGSEVKQ